MQIRQKINDSVTDSISDGAATAAAGITFDDLMDLFYFLKAP